MNLILPQVFRWVSEDLASGRLVWSSLASSVVALVGSVVFSYLGTYFGSRVEENFAGEVREQIISTYYRIPYLRQEEILHSRLTSLIDSDVELLKPVPTRLYSQVIPSFLLLLAILSMMLWTDWRLFLFLSLALVFLILCMLVLAAPLRRLSYGVQTRVESTLSALEASCSEILLVRSQNALAWARGLSLEASSGLRVARIRLERYRSAVGPINNMLVQLLIIGVFVYSYVRIVYHGAELSNSLVFIGYLFVLLIPIGVIANYLSIEQTALAAHKRVLDFLEEVERPGYSLDAVEAVSGFSGKRLPEGAQFSLRVSDLVVGYDGVGCLGPVSFEVSLGEVLFVVGDNGIGKTTLLKAMAGIVRPLSGLVEVLCNGEPCGSIDDLPEFVRLFPQGAPVIPGTVEDNLMFGRLMPVSSLDSALRRVQLELGSTDRFSPKVSLEAGRASGMSGGERQRLSWARVVLSDVPIILMDEPSSGVDLSGASVLVGILKEKVDRCAIVVVTHDEELVRSVSSVLPSGLVRKLLLLRAGGSTFVE